MICGAIRYWLTFIWFWYKTFVLRKKTSSVTVIWDLAFFTDMLSISRLFTPLCQFPLHPQLDKIEHNHDWCHVRNSPLTWRQTLKKTFAMSFWFLLQNFSPLTLAPYNRLSICLLNSSPWGFYIVMLCDNL